MGITRRNTVVVLIVSMLSALAVGPAAAQARGVSPYQVARAACRVQHIGAESFCAAMENRKAIRVVRSLELREARRTHASVKIGHRLSWKVGRLRRANRWERARLRHLQSMPTWIPTNPVELGHLRAAQVGWTDANGQWGCLYRLWNRESGWSTPDTNSSSGAAGIPQALPPSKMGPGWETNIDQQIGWGIRYIEGRYGDACSAWAHSNAFNWY